MIKSYEKLRKQNKDKIKVPKRAQDVIDIDTIYKDGIFCSIIGIWFRLVDKCLKQILTMSKIKSNAPALLYFSACKNVTRYIIF